MANTESTAESSTVGSGAETNNIILPVINDALIAGTSCRDINANENTSGEQQPPSQGSTCSNNNAILNEEKPSWREILRTTIINPPRKLLTATKIRAVRLKNNIKKRSKKHAWKIRLVTLLFLQFYIVGILVWDRQMLRRDIRWNRAIDRKVPAPLYPSAFSNYTHLDYSGFDEPQLLKKYVAPMIASIIHLAIVLHINFLALVFERWKRIWLPYLNIIYALLSVSLSVLYFIQEILSTYNPNYVGDDKLLEKFDRIIPKGANRLPVKYPEGETISLKKNIPFLLQVFGSCTKGSTDEWVAMQKMTENKEFTVPTYNQLTEIGFCTNLLDLNIHLRLTLLVPYLLIVVLLTLSVNEDDEDQVEEVAVQALEENGTGDEQNRRQVALVVEH